MDTCVHHLTHRERIRESSGSLDDQIGGLSSVAGWTVSLLLGFVVPD